METNQNTNIIKNYQKFFIFVFKYFFLFLVIALSGFFFQKIFIAPTGLDSTDPFSLQKIKLVATFEKFLKHAVQDNNLQIYILQWPLLVQNNFLVSQDNLITYKWFIVPRYLAIATTLPIKQAAYFDSSDYTTGELEQFVSNFILVSQDNSSHVISNTQIPINNWLISNFNLSCLAENKVFAATCTHYLDNFLSSFFVYQLHMDYTWLQSIFASTTQATYRTRFCEGMKKYLLYANDTDPQISDIFDQCGSWYSEFYKRMGFFVDIQQQLGDKYISPDVYKDQLLNVYKLLSYQQILYQDFQELKIRKNQYTIYLAYVQELLRRHALPQFYFDELYRYNTYYLKPTLLTIRYDRRRSGIKEWDITQVIKSIDTINIGDPLFNDSGLVLLVSNPKLIQSATAAPATEVLSLQQQIAKKIAALSYFTVAQSAISNNIVDAQWYFIINDQKIPSKLQLSYNNDTFLVKRIEMPDYLALSAVMQWLIKARDTSIGEFFAALSKNLPLYQNTTPPIKDLLSICAQIRSLESWLAMQVSTCTQNVLVLSKIINQWTVTYSFLLQNFFPTDITVSDAALQTDIGNAMKQDNYSPSTLTEAVQFILSVQPSAASVHLGSTNTLITLEDFQNFLGITANDIAEKNGVILVDFSVKGINFIANFDVIKHNITALYFKDILSSGQPLPIKKFALSLNDANQDVIDSFVKDPLTYIKKIDLTARRNYTTRN